MDVSTTLQNLKRNGHPVDGYLQLVDTILATSESAPYDAVNPVLRAVLQEEMPLLVARQVLDHICSKAAQLDPISSRALLSGVVDAITPRTVSFEEQITNFQEAIATLCEAEQDWQGAVRALMRIPLDSTHRIVAPKRQVKTYMRILDHLVRCNEYSDAESYLNRATLLVHDHGDAQDQHRLKLVQARLLDVKGRFSDASVKYYQLSLTPHIAKSDCDQYLKQAVICAVMSPAGPQRSRVLSILYKDERTRQLTDLFAMLEKVYLDRVLAPADVALFSQHLAPHHQKTTLGDGSTALERAVLEHNLLSVSRLYDNIRISALARLLDVTEARAESMVARMLGERRICGHVDQVDGLVVFERAASSTTAPVGPARTASATGDEQLQATQEQAFVSTSAVAFTHWDDKLQRLCSRVEDVVGEVVARHPGWSRARGEASLT